VQSIRSRL